MNQEKAGDAIRVLQEAEKFYETSIGLLKEYNKMKGPGKSAKPDQHLFFRKLQPLMNRIKGMIHDKMSSDP